MYWVIHTCLGFVGGISNFGNIIRKNNALKRVGFVVSVAFAILCLMFVFPVYVEPEYTKAAPGDPSPVTLDFVSVRDVLVANVAPSSVDGTAAKSSNDDKASFNISTNNATGYTLNVKVGEEESDENLMHEEWRLETISRILESGVDYDVFASNTSFNNTWGIIPSTYFSDNTNNSNNTDKLFPATASGVVMAVTDEPNSAADDYDTYYIGLGLKVDYDTLAGNYVNSTIIAEYVANPVSYSIYYYANTEDEVTDMPEFNPQSGLVMLEDNPTVPLATAPTRDGYVFMGWCAGDDDSTSNITVEDEKDICNSTLYEAEEEFSIDDSFNYYMYAAWWPETIRIIYDGGELYYNDEPTETRNEVTYLNNVDYYTESFTRYSHTPSVRDDGTQSSYYTNNYTMRDIITIEGAETLHIRLTWGGESDAYDWVSFWAGNYPDYTAISNYSTGVRCGSNTSGKYGGGSHTSANNTVECDIPGDTVTFAFRSDSSQNGDGYGYYAVVTADVMMPFEYLVSVSDTYAVPATSFSHAFLGWSEEPDALTPTYLNEADIMENSGYTFMDSPITLYAVYDIYHDVIVNMDENVDAVSFVNPNYPAQNVTTSGSTIQLRRGTEYIVTASIARTYTIDSWLTTGNGVLGDVDENPTSYVVLGDTTLSITSQEAGPLQIIYDGNGLTFEDDATTNVVTYDASVGVQYATMKYSHTPNVRDDGTQSGNYSHGYTKRDIITVEGADTLHIRLTWGGESDAYDWVSFWAGNYPSYSAYSNYSTGVKCGSNTSGKYGGGSYMSASNTVECDIPGDTVTFAFRSDGSGVGDGYGYYAVVTGRDANYDWIDVGEPTTSYSTFQKTVVSGEYAVPDSDSLYDFLGWSEDKDAIVPTYVSEEDIKANFDALNGEVFTLYAIYDRYLTVHFDANGGDGGSMSDQIILNRTTVNLTAVGLTRTNHTFLWWNTEADDSGTRYYDLASYAVSDVNLGEVRTLYAQWGELTTINVTLDEHSRSVAVYNENYPAYEIFNQNNNGDGTHTTTIDIYVGIRYTVTATFATGYEFKNWVTVENSVFENANSNPTIYTISGDTTLSIVSRIITPPSRCSTPFPGYTYMQDLMQGDHNEILNSVNANTQYYLRDVRDLKPYCVSKLADGNLWMTSDLYLGSIYETTTLTSADSDLNGEFVLSIAETSDTKTQWGTAGTSDNLDSIHVYRYNTTKNLYNWHTATGGTTHTSNSADTSICPVGWKMFTKLSGENYLLAVGVVKDTTTTTILTNAPQNFTDGLYDSSSMAEYTNRAYWTSDGFFYSSGGYYDGYYFGISNSRVSTSSGYQKWYGLGVRCILASPSYTVTVSMDSDISSVTLTDASGNVQTATEGNPDVILKQGVSYIITINTDSVHELASWETSENGTLSSTTDAPATYNVVGAATLTATSQVKQPLSTCSTPVPGITYMQELDDSNMASVVNSIETGVQYYLRDRRDNTPYCVSKIANAIWMTQNLRIVGTVSAEDSNFTGDDVNISTNDFKNNKTNCNSSNGYNNICSHAADVLDARTTSLNTKQLGVWYNYAAATAGKITGSSNSNAAAEDICPVGWHMPFYNTDRRAGSFQSVTNSSNRSSFNVVRGSYYIDGTFGNNSYGYWWSASLYSSSSRYAMYGYSNTSYGLEGWGRYSGLNIRCVKELTLPTEVSIDSNIDEVTFVAGDETRVANRENPTVYLTYGVTYNITATPKTGSEFVGWSTTENGTLGSETSNPTTYVVTGENILTISGQVMCNTPVPGVTYMQDITASNKGLVLAGMTTDAAYYILDSRDDERYCVSRLADGNLWLIDNLRLNLADATVLANVDETNTNADATSLNYLKNGGGTTSDQYATSGVAEWGNDVTFASSHSYSDPLIATSGACGNDTTCIDMPLAGQWAMDDTVPLASSYGRGSGKVGAYYNYCAASAGSYCYGDGNTGYGTSVDDASQDICPSGWRMPTGGNNGEYSVLRSMYDNDDGRYRAALSLSLTGYFNDGLAYSQGTNGLINSATRNDDGSMFNVGFSASAINLLDTSSRSFGASVRCILESPSYEITVHMDENVNSVTVIDAFDNATSLVDGNTITLKQGVSYTIMADYASGYGMDSWSTSEEGIITNAALPTTTYVINGDATLTLASKQLVGLEAPATCDTPVPNYTYMQDIRASVKTALLNDLAVNAPYYLRDARDNEPYCVSKLADGKLWLLDNLRLDLTDETVFANISEKNTNASATSINYLKNGGGTTSDKYAINGVAEWSSSGINYTYSRPLISTGGNCDTGSTGTGGGYCANDPEAGQWNKNSIPKYNGTEMISGNGSGKIGVYYNYCAATAGSYCYGNGTSYGSSSGNATEDVCPLGWRLPTGGSSGEFRNLCNVVTGTTCSSETSMTYTDASSLQYILSTPISGYSRINAYSQGLTADFWSSTRYNNYHVYYMTIYSAKILSQYYNYRYEGRSIRCILK